MSTGLYAALIAVAFCGGWIDSIAGGGGLVTLPALLIAGIAPHVALGTNKLQAVCGATASSLRYFLGNKVRRRLLLGCVPLALAGSALGSSAILRVSPTVIKPLLVPIFVVIGIYMALRKETGAEADPAKGTGKRLVAVLAGTFLIGFYDGFFGPGTGIFLFMLLVLVYGMEAVEATGTTKVINWATNLAAVVVFFRSGSIDFTLGLSMAAANVLGALTGSHMVIKKGQRFIRLIVMIVVLALAAKIGYDSFLG